MDLKFFERYEAETSPPPPGVEVPKMFLYIHFKAYSYLVQGPDAYRAQDALGMPPKGASPFVLALIERGCRQILEWKGIDPRKPLESIGINGFYRLMDLFHFEVVGHSASSSDDGTFLDKMMVRHVVTGEEMILYNRVK